MCPQQFDSPPGQTQCTETGVTQTCVILVNYRGSRDTAACVRSLLASTCPITVVVVDTTPHDPLLAEALTFAPGVILLRAAHNAGFGGGNNLGIDWAAQHTACSYFFLLNNDTVVFPDTIVRLEQGMCQHPRVGILIPRIAYLDNPELLWYGGGEMDWRRVGAFTPGINERVDAPLAMRERDVSFASGCALFLRRPAMRALRGFDARYFMYEEDTELCLRAHALGIRIRYYPLAFLLHKAQGSSRAEGESRVDFWDSKSPQLAFLCLHSMRNRTLTLINHARGVNLCVALLFYPIYLLRRAWPILRAGRHDALVAMGQGLLSAWHARRRVPLPPWPGTD